MRFNQFLNRDDGVGIVAPEELLAVSLGGAIEFADEQGFARNKMLHDRAEDHGFEIRPIAAGFRDGDEVRTKKYAGDAVDREQRPRERRLSGSFGVSDV